MSLKRYSCSLLLTTLMVSTQGAYAAPIPVVDSKPNEAQVQETSAENTEKASPSAGASSGTAHMLNLIDELRGEIMTLRGQVEEQAYQIRQLKQENRDRYLDLDDRITRLGGAAPAAGQSSETSLHTPAVAATAEPKAGSLDDKEEAAYQAAFALIREKQFDEALAALRSLLKDYPRGKFSDNAQYWLGEVQMAQGKYKEAKDDFLVVVNDYPDSPKVPDAAYKLGRLYDLMGDKAQARKHLESVVKKYPDSAAARLSDTYLRNMSDS